MQQELRADFPDLPISILGVNDHVSDIGNESVTADRDLPWLQDTDVDDDLASDVWQQWNVIERDVIILDGRNVEAARFNLTANDLGNVEHYETLRDLFVEIASLEELAENPSRIAGKVFIDVNNNGSREADELAVGNVQVTLTGYTDNGQFVEMTQFTEADGEYAFQGLLPGTYTVSQAQPSFLLDGMEAIGTGGGESSSNQFVIELDEGVNAIEYNFCEMGRTAQSISLLDVLSSSSQSGMLAAVDSTTGDHWFALQNEWTEFQFADITLDAQESTVAVEARDTHGHTFQGEFDLAFNDARILDVQQNETLVYISGTMIDLTELARNNSEETAEGEAVSIDSVGFQIAPIDGVLIPAVSNDRANAIDAALVESDWQQLDLEF